MGGGSETRGTYGFSHILGGKLAEVTSLDALNASVRQKKKKKGIKKTPDWRLDQVGRCDAVYGDGEAGGGASVRRRSGAQF